MKYYLYKITNNVNNKVYVGVHQTKNLDDGYMGSGKYLINAIEKYGIENFSKDILMFFDTKDEMFIAEANIVDEHFVKRPDTYNLKIGGEGGWPSNIDKGYMKSEFYREKRSEIAKKSWKSGKMSVDKNISKAFRSNSQHLAFKGRNHTDQSKKKIGLAVSKKQSGNNNSQYGTMWIHSLEEKKSKKIPKNNPIPEGWIKGRKMKFN